VTGSGLLAERVTVNVAAAVPALPSVTLTSSIERLSASGPLPSTVAEASGVTRPIASARSASRREIGLPSEDDHKEEDAGG
jgi:hypothetical protein